MSKSIGIPDPDCHARHTEARARRAARDRIADRRPVSETIANGEEVAYDLSYALNYHKGLPHDVTGAVHMASYNAMVRMLIGQEYGAVETLPIGMNRSGKNGVETNPPRYAVAPGENPLDAKSLRPYRKLTSPFTGHVFDTQGADAGGFAIAPAPLVASDELAAEMAELYAMALLRDESFTAIAAKGPADPLVQALGTMSWFNGSYVPTTAAEQRRFEARAPVATGNDLFRGSTPGAKAGPWLSQYMLMGNSNENADFRLPNDTPIDTMNPASQFVRTRAEVGREDGFILYGTQIVDQRSIVAQEGIDYLTNWAAWLDCQNGADFNGLDAFRHRRRFLTTPRDIVTYVHYDALYQAYLNACLLMLADSTNFPKDRGMPETASRTRSAFASFGGPHVLSMVTEVATRGLKAVWRHKWMHHRRARPEVIAGLLTLHANDPSRIESESLQKAVGDLRMLIPQSILDAVDAHNVAQNAGTVIQPKPAQPANFPVIANGKNYLLPMAFPEGSPTHPAYGAGHATVAGACVTVLKAFFEMSNPNGSPRAWPYPEVFVAQQSPFGGTLVDVGGAAALTVEGELDKLAANISIARNMAGVHYSTDYYESLRLGERIAVTVIEDHLSMYGEPVSMSFTSFDGDHVRISANGGEAHLRIQSGAALIPPESWLDRYAA
jgi:hypothetical protein